MEHLNGCLPLTIGGKPRKMYFDYTFAGILFDIVPFADFDKTLQTTPWRMLPLITYAALQAGDDENELPADFSEKLAGRWLMGLDQIESNKITEVFQLSMGFILASYQPAKVGPDGAKPAPKAKIKASL